MPRQEIIYEGVFGRRCRGWRMVPVACLALVLLLACTPAAGAQFAQPRIVVHALEAVDARLLARIDERGTG